jgi:hypothetical protein
MTEEKKRFLVQTFNKCGMGQGREMDLAMAELKS